MMLWNHKLQCNCVWKFLFILQLYEIRPPLGHSRHVFVSYTWIGILNRFPFVPCLHIACISLCSVPAYFSDFISIMGAQLKGPLRSLNMIAMRLSKGFQGDPELVPHDVETRQSLGQLYVRLLLFFRPCLASVQACKNIWIQKRRAETSDCSPIKLIRVHAVFWHEYSTRYLWHALFICVKAVGKCVNQREFLWLVWADVLGVHLMHRETSSESW